MEAGKTLIVMLVLISVSSCATQEGSDGKDVTAIKAVLEGAYVEGIHINRDTVAVRNGFHPNFVMFVFDDGEIINATLDMWLDRMNMDGTKNTKTIEHEFTLVDVTGNSAIARMEIHEDSKHKYTDYFSLYRFDDGWKIVGKIFYSHF